mmetsp:Transcript_14226/g.59525  ORF Transcript_14226/g.59525 Transcript_14226/m.59525 type:complete len:306 (-) Transcript_14226:840-1757(-)
MAVATRAPPRTGHFSCCPAHTAGLYVAPPGTLWIAGCSSLGQPTARWVCGTRVCRRRARWRDSTFPRKCAVWRCLPWPPRMRWWRSPLMRPVAAQRCASPTSPRAASRTLSRATRVACAAQRGCLAASTSWRRVEPTVAYGCGMCAGPVPSRCSTCTTTPTQHSRAKWAPLVGWHSLGAPRRGARVPTVQRAASVAKRGGQQQAPPLRPRRSSRVRTPAQSQHSARRLTGCGCSALEAMPPSGCGTCGAAATPTSTMRARRRIPRPAARWRSPLTAAPCMAVVGAPSSVGTCSAGGRPRRGSVRI